MLAAFADVVGRRTDAQMLLAHPFGPPFLFWHFILRDGEQPGPAARS
jgi:hypothetical protein